MNAPGFHLEQRQNQTLTPRLQQAVRLLQLSSMDFGQELQQALSTNPFLELEDYPADDEAMPDNDESGNEAEESTPMERDNQDQDDGLLDPFPDQEPWGQSGTVAPASGGSALDLMDLTPVDITLHDHLHGQLNLLNLSPTDRMLTGVLVEALDEDGYLRTGLDELIGQVQDETVGVPELQFALNLVQSLEPAGVACRDVQECLLLQLREQTEEEGSDLALRIITEQFQRLVRHDIPGLAHALHTGTAEIERACAHIGKLDPRPGWRFGKQATAYLTPDIIVRKQGERWVASLNQAAVPKVRINQVYADLFHRHREAHHGELASHLQEARWTVRNIEQRFHTILRVAEAIVEAQQAFFEHGTLAMQPMGLKEIAETLELHESTISRATCNKYMASPAGVFELKYFFSRSLSTNAGDSCSTTAIRAAIKEMIHAESPTQPLSDAEITRRLTQLGLKVARRTVTKYRQMMHIPAVEMRRQFS
ncbi:RNA polymerase factor sigma-54 [Chitinimonas naiadis]